MFDFDDVFSVDFLLLLFLLMILLFLLDLKPLPDSLKYAFLGPYESLPMLIASNLEHD